MERRLFEHIAEKIHRHRTWIKVVDTKRWTEYNMIVDGHLQKCLFRVLTLESFRVKYGFIEPRTWNVSEYDIARGVVALTKKDPVARKRIRQCRLTIYDVEFIIEKATFGIVKLELDKYDL